MDRPGLIKSRLNTRIDNARAHAGNEAENIARYIGGLDFTQDPVVTLGQAERLAKAAVDLVRYTAAIVALDDAYELLGED